MEYWEEINKKLKPWVDTELNMTVVLTRPKFRQFMVEIAWETEVWIADNPDHLVHFNGDKFLGPYKQ